MNWISLKDQLPPENMERVLFASDDGDVNIGYYSPNEGVWNDEKSVYDTTKPAIVFSGGDWSAEFYGPTWSRNGWDYGEAPADFCPENIVTITHWMPLPEHPNKESK